MTGGMKPATVRKAAALVERLDSVLDEFGARLADGSPPIRFVLIGSDVAGAEPKFEAVPVDDADPRTPTGLTIGFVR